MKIAIVTKYAVKPALISTALTPKESAIWGKAVAMIVPSKFSIKKDVATISGTAIMLKFLINVGIIDSFKYLALKGN
jgi:hypothetical protein